MLGHTCVLSYPETLVANKAVEDILETNAQKSKPFHLIIFFLPEPDPLRYLATFFVSNKAVEDFFKTSAQEAFLSAVRPIWPDVTLRLHILKSGKELGLRAPLPTDANQKEG